MRPDPVAAASSTVASVDRVRIAIGSDHAGFGLKEQVTPILESAGHEVIDGGTDSEEPVDYAQFAAPAARLVPDGVPETARAGPLGEVGPAVGRVLGRQVGRQQNTRAMSAAEYFVPQAVLEAAGSVLPNTYAEGYPGRRYYGGCEEVDVAERLAIDRALELFGAEHANVQPHAGAQANNAAYMAMLEPGDTIMGLALDHGGHLTHGMKLNVSGKLYEVVPYHVSREDLRVDMDEV